MTKNDIKRALWALTQGEINGGDDPQFAEAFIALLNAGGESADPVDLSGVVLASGGNMTGALTFATSAVIVSPDGSVSAKRFKITGETLGYAASIALDFSTNGWKSIVLTGNIVFTTAGLATDREIAVRIVSDGSSRNLSFPVGWVFVGATAPASIAANKTAILSLRAFGSTDATVVASYVVQA